MVWLTVEAGATIANMRSIWRRGTKTHSYKMTCSVYKRNMGIEKDDTRMTDSFQMLI